MHIILYVHFVRSPATIFHRIYCCDWSDLQGRPKNGTIFRTPYNFAKY